MALTHSEDLLGMLAFLGAPLVVDEYPVDDDAALDVLVRGVELARSNAVLARVLPVVLWRQRAVLSDVLSACHGNAEARQAVGFMMHLTSELVATKAPAEAQQLHALAVQLYSETNQVVPFFHNGSGRTSSGSDVLAAQQWGFSLNTSMANFQQQFDKSYRA
jgi:hypothetical protein